MAQLGELKNNVLHYCIILIFKLWNINFVDTLLLAFPQRDLLYLGNCDQVILDVILKICIVKLLKIESLFFIFERPIVHPALAVFGKYSSPKTLCIQ